MRFVVLAVIVAALAGCKHRKHWGTKYFEIHATPLDFPVTEYKLKHPDIGSFDYIAQVKDPDAILPSQRLAIVYVLGDGGSVDDNCTGFFVSKRDFLTAGHCVKDSSPNPSVDVDLGAKLGTRTAKCSVFPAPPSVKSQDWAICSFGEDLDLGETFALTKCAPKPNDQVVITGFCQVNQQAGVSAESITPAKTPNAGVLEMLAPEQGFLPGQPLPGRSTSGCPLDSGGPAFLPEQLTRRSDNFYVLSGKTRVFGVVADIGICPPGQNNRTCIAPTTDPSFLSFLNDHKTGAVDILDCSE